MSESSDDALANNCVYNVKLYRSEVEFGMRAETEWLQNMYGNFLKLLVNDSFWRSDPGFLFWGRRLVSPRGTVSRADMVWTDAMLAVLRCQVQQTPP